MQRTAERHYGCRIGMVQVLHTWGQQLGLHVHTHVVMTAAGVSLDGDRWVPISVDQTKTRPAQGSRSSPESVIVTVLFDGHGKARNKFVPINTFRTINCTSNEVAVGSIDVSLNITRCCAYQKQECGIIIGTQTRHINVAHG